MRIETNLTQTMSQMIEPPRFKLILTNKNVLIMNLIKQNKTLTTENRDKSDSNHVSDYQTTRNTPDGNVQLSLPADPPAI